MEKEFQHHLSRMPDNTAIKQQKLPAHQLHFSDRAVFAIFFGTGVFCVCIGIILTLSAKNTQEIEINYTNNCENCAELRENALNFDKNCTCSISFYLRNEMKGDVYMYYKLYGFYQNLYRYVLSRSNNQLLGKDLMDVANCAPFTVTSNKTPIAPCGAIANSMFNDTITLSYAPPSSVHIPVPMLKSGLTWWTDKYVKFQNPRIGNLSNHFIGTEKPPHWQKPVYELDTDNPGNNGFLNDDFIVWMRTAAFPNFRKLYGKLFREKTFSDGLPADFPVTKFQGEKSVILSTLTWSGSSSLFLGLSYTVTGISLWLASFALMAIKVKMRKKKLAYRR